MRLQFYKTWKMYGVICTSLYTIKDPKEMYTESGTERKQKTQFKD